MPKPLQPDTSPQNVARVLRQAHAALLGTLTYGLEEHRRLPSTLHSLADALERQAGVTWEERINRATEAYALEVDYGFALEGGEKSYRMLIADALRAAFPEYAPTESASDD